MNSNKIESNAVSTLNLQLNKSDYLEPNINEKDKEPSWDGSITVYKPNIIISKNRTVDEIQGIVPIQVKGKEVKSLSKITKTYKMKLSHLRNYYNTGGTVLFVVFMTENNEDNKIYYNDLLPAKLESILEASNQITKHISLKELPDDINDMTNIFYKFLLHSKMQHSFINGKILSLDYYTNQEGYKGLGFHFQGVGIENEYEWFEDNEIYPYVIMENAPLPIPIKNIIKQANPLITNYIDISVNGTVFYNSIEVILSKNKYTVNIGHSTKLYIDVNNSMTLRFERTNYLRNLVVDLDFIINVIDNGGFNLDGHFNEIDKNIKFSGDFDINLARQSLTHLKKYIKLLDICNVKEDIDLSKLTSDDSYKLELLVSAIVDEKEVISNSPHKIFTQIFSISNLNFYTLLVKNDDNYKVYDYFNTIHDNFKIDDNTTSQFMILSSEQISKLSNINYDNVKTSFENIENKDIKFRDANTFLLTVLNAYDVAEKKLYRENLLNFSLEFSKWILDENSNSEDSTNYQLNYYQTLKRANLITPEIRQDLVNMSIEIEDVHIKFAANVLLDQEDYAMYYFKKFDRAHQQFILSLPISNFLSIGKTTANKDIILL